MELTGKYELHGAQWETWRLEEGLVLWIRWPMWGHPPYIRRIVNTRPAQRWDLDLVIKKLTSYWRVHHNVNLRP